MKLMGCFGFVVFAMLATLGLWFLEGYTITKFWGWFITPTFDVKTPGIWTCVGLAMLIGFLTNHSWSTTLKDQLEKDDDDSSKSMLKPILLMLANVARMLLVLLCGWIVHCIGG